MNFIKAFGAFFAISFGGGAAVYSLLAAITEQLSGRPAVFAGLYRMFMYHSAHPFQYLAVVAIVYSFFASVWATRYSDSTAWRRWLQITIVLLISLIVSSVLGGVLWKFHDMQAGHFPESPQIWRDFRWGASTGLLLGPLIVLLSFPLNTITIIAGYAVTHKAPEFLRLRRNPKRGKLRQ